MYFQSGRVETIPPGFYKTLKKEIKMKKTIFMLPALALMLFAACSSEDAVTKDNTAQLNETPENAIGFDAYLNRTTTRAGKVGVLDNSKLQAADAGFGVFAYYADGDLYTENATPNFMYNQKVYYYTGDWKYEPIKYWPNEFGSQAISTGVDRVTFFAYAPYVAVEPTTGQLTSTYTGDETTMGITSLTRNGKSGDPYVRYVGTFNHADCVDLCYGVAAEAFTSSVGSGDGANKINKGEPYINVAKPAVGSKIYFDFKHALAMLNVNVDADVDIVSHDGGDVLDGKTRIWVRSITFDGIAQRGYLNLNSGIWYDIMDNNKISHASVTIHDGRRDGSEALADDTYESPTGFNDALVQSGVYNTAVADGTTFPYTSFECSDDTRTGVTGENKDLFGGSLMVIPANEQLKVTIVYDVETADATLPTYLSDGSTKGSTVENKITKNITLGGSALKLESGKAYTLNLHLGMTSVTFNATVSDWVEGGEANVDLPFNADNGNAVANSTSNVVLNANETTGTFTITGLGSDANTIAVSHTGDISSATAPTNPSSGISVVNYSFAAANNTVNNKSGVITVTEKEGGNLISATTINVTQKAASLGLKVTDVSGSDIELGCATGLTDPWTSVSADGDHVKVSKTSGGTTTALEYTSGYSYDAANNKITLVTAPAAGDVYTITIQAGDAEAETVTARIGAISFATTSNVTVGVNRTFTQTVNNTGTGAVSYASSETSKATVNSSTGLVTGVAVSGAANDVTITATVTDDPTNGWFYLTTTATYTLTVKTVGTVSFAEAVVNKSASDANFTKVATITTGGTVAYSSSNGSVATVNPSTGEVTIVGAGTTTITATATDGALVTYPVKTASYTLNVTKANARIYFDAASYTEASEHESGFKTVKYDPTGANEGAVVTWTSSDTSKATIDTANNKVVQVGPACTVTITAKVTDTAKYHFIVDTASYELTFSTATTP